jgi:hypothetical protein
MTGRLGPRADRLRAPWARRWWAVDRPGFWFLAGAVFAGNGLFFAWQHYWWLALMQVGTAMLAVRAAAFMTGVADQVPDGHASEKDRGAGPTRGGLIGDPGVPPGRR